MAFIAPAITLVHPSFMEPEILLQYNQASGAFDTLPGAQPRQRLSENDLVVYIKRMEVRTRIAAGQSAYNQLPSCNIVATMIQTPTYLMRVRSEYDHHDTAAVGEWGTSIVEAYRYAMRQGHFQQARNALLYGFSPQNGEGLLNTQGATAVTLPADPYGNTTATTYDNGAMASFLLQQILTIKTRTFQLGRGREFTILGPQRVLGLYEYNIVQLTSFQRPGGGTLSTEGVTKAVLMDNGDKLLWAYDDTLIGKGAGGTDAVLITMPNVEKPTPQNSINTSEWSKLTPGLDACLAMYADMAAPREIPTPMPGGFIDVLSEWRISSGWGIRPEAITVISIPYP